MRPFELVSSTLRGARAFHRAPAVLFVATILAFGVVQLISCCGGGGDLMGSLSLVMSAMSGTLTPERISEAMGDALKPSPFAALVWIAKKAFDAFLAAGRARVSREILDGGRGEFRTLFSGADCWVRLVGAEFYALAVYGLTYLVAGLPALPCFWMALRELPGPPDTIDVTYISYLMEALLAERFLYWNIAGLSIVAVITVPVTVYVFAGVAFVKQYVAIEGLSLGEAIPRAWDLANGNRIAITNFALLNAIFRYSGALFCIVGSFYTEPVATVAYNDAFLRLTGRSQPSDPPTPG